MIMDYEKAYKEALEKARDFHKANELIGDIEENYVLEDIFTELKESEDEMIRKELIHLFQSDTPQQFGEFTNEQFIAWLEKQGEEKTAEWSGEDEKMCQETIDWFEKKCFPYALESENPARESIKWLKSLRLQNHWKPSDEQMAALCSVMGDSTSTHYSSTLHALYNDLKQLL